MNKSSIEDPLTQTIIQLIEEKEPRNIPQLVNLVKEKTFIPKQQIIEHVLRLQNRGKITLKELSKPSHQKLGIYVKTKEAYWYWTIIILILTTTLTVLTVPENAYPIVYVRYLLGSIFVLFLPGYSLIKALFPIKELDNIERIALSIGMSLAVVPITGLLLNYTPWGIRATPVTLSVLAQTTVFATVALIREYAVKLKEESS